MNIYILKVLDHCPGSSWDSLPSSSYGAVFWIQDE